MSPGTDSRDDFKKEKGNGQSGERHGVVKQRQGKYLKI